jgi:drug/metabolite transporter (DMT)-like permease
MVAAAAAIWGSIGVTGKVLFSRGLDAGLVSSARVLLAFLMMASAMLCSRRDLLRIGFRDALLFLCFGVFGTGAYTLLYMLAIEKTTASLAVVLLYTAPFFAILVSRVVFGEPLTRAKGVGLLLAAAGVAMCVGGRTFSLTRADLHGIACGLGSGLAYGLFGVFGKIGLKRHDYRTVVTYSLGFAAVFLAAFRPPWAVPAVTRDPRAWAALLYLAAGPTVLSYCLYPVGL